MLFVIDVGNSHTVTGLYKDGELLGSWRLKTDRNYTADELAIRYHGLFRMEGIEVKDISYVVLASVVPTLESAWVRCVERHFDTKEPILNLYTENMSPIVTVDTDNPNEVGIDRLVNAYAAWKIHRTNLIVIDFGTAITFDCVTENCTYLGGVILPGIAISLEALSSKTAKLPMIDVQSSVPKLIGKNTVDAMRSGLLYGYGSMVDGIVEGIRSEMLADSKERNIHVVATGGMAHLIAPYTESIQDIDPLLTLNGMKTIHYALKEDMENSSEAKA